MHYNCTSCFSALQGPFKFKTMFLLKTLQSQRDADGFWPIGHSHWRQGCYRHWRLSWHPLWCSKGVLCCNSWANLSTPLAFPFWKFCMSASLQDSTYIYSCIYTACMPSVCPQWPLGPKLTTSRHCDVVDYSNILLHWERLSLSLILIIDKGLIACCHVLSMWIEFYPAD